MPGGSVRISAFLMPADQQRPELATPAPPQTEEAPRFADGLVPEAPPRRRGWWVFVGLVFVVGAVVLLRALSGGTPYLLVAGIYFPAWFSAGVVGIALATVTVVALRSYSVTRAAGTGLVFCNCTGIYAFLVWFFLFQ